MKVKVIQVPYDSGRRSLRMGAGPEHFVNSGLASVLQNNGHDVSIETIDSEAAFQAEVQTQFELYRLLAESITEAKSNGEFPLVLSGNCGATVGVIAGMGAEHLGVVWFDTHGEFNTPETTSSGFMDGMGLAVATGLCWKTLASSIPGFQPLSGKNILLIGGHDFDAGERERLEQAGVTVIDSATVESKGIQDGLSPTIVNLRNTVEEVHLHIDLDALNPKEAPANSFVTEEGGLRGAQLIEAIRLIQQDMDIVSATIASYDPTYDVNGKTLQAGFRLVEQILGE